MAKAENKMMRRRLANAYLSSVISISLVLLLIGVASLLLVNAGSVSRYFKENLQLSVILNQDAEEDEAAVYAEQTSRLPFIRNARLVTRDEGTEELKALLGEDFLSVFEASPVPLSVEISLEADYVSSDSLDKVVIPALCDSDLVEEIESQSSLIDALNTNLARISLVLGVFIALMLFISFMLIGNTVRLSVFARRFTIHTMKLVGATRSFIRKPFMIRAVFQGLISSVIAIAILAGVLLALRSSFEQLFSAFGLSSQLVVAGIMLASGVVICVLSTFFVVNKLTSLSKDELYY